MYRVMNITVKEDFISTNEKKKEEILKRGKNNNKNVRKVISKMSDELPKKETDAIVLNYRQVI